MQRVDHSFKAMGGPCNLRLEVNDQTDADAAIKAAVGEVQRLEKKYSRYTTDSLTTQINRAAGGGKPVPVDTETAGLLSYANTLWQQSNGLFDLTSGVLRKAWDFKSGRHPQQSELDVLLPLVGWQQLEWDENSVYLPQVGMELDFGGCVKEYAADSAAAQLRQHDVCSALVDLAGDLAVVGTPAGKRGWPVGIRHPVDKEHAIAQIEVPEGGLASSGDYERCLESDGKRYGHILHPQTGWPIQGLVGVSVLAGQCLVAGSTATIAMLKPAEEALTWLESLGLPWLAIDADLVCHGTLSGDSL
jgi:thiamine biosynthesis lipoprotein